MDESVLKAIAKWPDVPDVFNWLGLDRRGNWLLRNDPIRNTVITGFIGRNYLADKNGRWFFQNGPQRVFVTLEYAPFVVHTSRSGDDAMLVTQTGTVINRLAGACMDEYGSILVEWASGVGLVCDRDLSQVVMWLTDAAGNPVSDAVLETAVASSARGETPGLWLDYRSHRVPVQSIHLRDIPETFGFVACPQPAPGQAEC